MKSLNRKRKRLIRHILRQSIPDVWNVPAVVAPPTLTVADFHARFPIDQQSVILSNLRPVQSRFIPDGTDVYMGGGHMAIMDKEKATGIVVKVWEPHLTAFPCPRLMCPNI